MVSFWEDYYRKHPIDAKKTKDGDVRFETGDPLIDKWESELARGLTPDLTEGLDSVRRELVRRKKEETIKKEELKASLDNLEDFEGFSEDYTVRAQNWVKHG